MIHSKSKLFIALSLAGQCAFAETEAKNDKLEEVTISASRYETLIKETGSSVSVLTEEDLEL